MYPVSPNAQPQNPHQPQKKPSRCLALFQKCCCIKAEDPPPIQKPVVVIEPSTQQAPPSPVEEVEESFVDVGPVVKVVYCTADGGRTLEPPRHSSLSTAFSLVQKGVNYSLLAIHSVPEENYSSLTTDPGDQAVLKALLGSSVQLLSNGIIERYVRYLANHYQRAALITFLGQALHDRPYIVGRDPKTVILKEWERSKRIIAYPFVWPPGNYLGACAHIVLILIDKEDREIRYFDSQGLTSGERSAPNVFKDDPAFKMSDNLFELAESLQKRDSWTLLENTTKHQTEPVNCGVYILSRLERVYRTLDPKQIFDADLADISMVRRNLGEAYQNSLIKKPSESTRLLQGPQTKYCAY